MGNTWFAYNPFEFNCDSKKVESTCQQPMDSLTRNNLRNQLQRSLKPEALLTVFYHEISHCLPISGLVFSREEEVYSLGKLSSDCFSMRQELRINNQVLGDLECRFSSDLSLVQSYLWYEFIEMPTYPLRNALEFQQMKQLALKDTLTGLFNRNKFDIAFQEAVNHSEAQSGSFSLLVFDLDGFKLINDTYGHQAGDLVLNTFAQILQGTSYALEQVFRFGGDEFTILHDGDKDEAQAIVADIQRLVKENSLLEKFQISCSIGHARYQVGDDMDSLFERADLALYRAKKNGKNCLELSPCVYG
ncbi:GGDEF domain-containing protein [Oceanospirillum beijerinckii]|uniref:GGDEF domain-containing protein n=1 Tax=Oceanospirillum beijerinckii TaxID=64976 RepID=UPI000412EA60|nr:GGDEF domain-containing protein [Oceanospirillum beijerinckii]